MEVIIFVGLGGYCALKKTCAKTNLPADARGQVLHNQTVLSAHRRRVSTENTRKTEVKTQPTKR